MVCVRGMLITVWYSTDNVVIVVITAVILIVLEVIMSYKNDKRHTLCVCMCVVHGFACCKLNCVSVCVCVFHLTIHR